MIEYFAGFAGQFFKKKFEDLKNAQNMSINKDTKLCCAISLCSKTTHTYIHGKILEENTHIYYSCLKRKLGFRV